MSGAIGLAIARKIKPVLVINKSDRLFRSVADAAQTSLNFGRVGIELVADRRASAGGSTGRLTRRPARPARLWPLGRDGNAVLDRRRCERVLHSLHDAAAGAGGALPGSAVERGDGGIDMSVIVAMPTKRIHINRKVSLRAFPSRTPE